MGEGAQLPLVSIVIPAYNQGEFLAQAIDSVLSQAYPRLELIVVDDGSTDGTPDVLAAYQGRCRIESQANCGQSATLNRGWAMARGDVLSYLAADDYLLPGAVAAAVDHLQAQPQAVLAYCDFCLVDAASRVVRHVRVPDFSFRDLAVNFICAPGPGVFFRQWAYRSAGPWDVALRQLPDYEFWLRLARQGGFVRVPRELAAYRVHDASQSFAPTSVARAEEPVLVIARFFATPPVPDELASYRDEALSNAHVATARFHLRSGRLGAALRHLGRAVRCWPPILARLRTYHLVANGLFNRVGHRLVWVANRLRTRPCRG